MDLKKEQFSQIYQDHIEKIYRFVYVKVDSAETAQDITSKVFLRAWEAFIAPGKGIENPGAFLYQTARNAVVDHYRAQGRSKTVPIGETEIAQGGTTIHQAAELAADVERVKTAIQQLKKDYQDVIILHYLEDLKTPEIAQLLGKPEGTVRVMIHRGLKDLRGIIQES